MQSNQQRQMAHAHAQHGNQVQMRSPTNPGSVIDELETAFRDCIIPFVVDEGSIGITFQDEQRPSVEHAIHKFLDLARRAEGYFLKQRASIATKHPELVLQEEVNELENEIKRKDDLINNHLLKLKQWQSEIKDLKSGDSSKKIPQPVVSATMMQHTLK